jgi:alkanesulfonate monooxygenase SsuD/methylene tetrahydromethanopterin reductase-like flavin-dependent oxidoreductase (luciferase family)
MTRLAFDVAPTVSVVVGDDIAACRFPVKAHLALYIGGMGARDKNFYNRYARDMGYEAEAIAIQDLFLAGRKEEAIAAVPDALVDEVALVGPLGRIRERAAAWRALGSEGRVGTLILGMQQPEHLGAIADILLG